MSTPDNDRVRKLTAVAFDEGATEGEKKAAILAVLRICMERKWKLEDLLKAIGPTTEPDFFEHKDDGSPSGWNTVMPFGKKHKGETLGVIARNDPGYIEWLMGVDLRNSLRQDVSSVWEWVQQQPWFGEWKNR